MPYFHEMNNKDRYRRTNNLTLADRRCSHTKLWFSGKILPVAPQAQEHVAKKDGERISLHQAGLHSATQWLWASNTYGALAPCTQQISNICIQKGCTAAPHSLSTKWWHPFLHVKHDEEEKTINPDPPLERYPWQCDNSHEHLKTMFETLS